MAKDEMPAPTPAEWEKLRPEVFGQEWRQK